MPCLVLAAIPCAKRLFLNTSRENQSLQTKRTAILGTSRNVETVRSSCIISFRVVILSDKAATDLKMLGLYLYILIICHKSCNMLRILNKLTLQNELHNFVTNNVL